MSLQPKEAGATNFVFVMAHSFSGSTLLSFLLGAHPEIATVGEMYISPAFNTGDYLCSCGLPIDECPFWRRVSREMEARGVPFDVRRSDTSFRTDGIGRMAYRMVTAEPRGWLFEAARHLAIQLLPDARRELERRLRVNQTLVDVVTGLRGVNVFVDTSKRPGRILLLRRIPSFDIRVIHLTRDGRGVTRSSLRNLGSSIEEGARSWASSIRSAEQVQKRFSTDRWLTVRHEDLCRDPDAEIERIVRFIGVTPGLQARDFRSFEHHIIGNRMRLNQTSEIRLDERWKTELTADQIRTVERIAGPELQRYGYEALDAEAPAPGLKPAQPAPGLSGRTLRRGGITYAATQYLGMVLGFIGSTLMVRMASPQDVASYLLLLQAINALGLTMQLGLGPAALRFAPICRGQGGGEATALLRRRLFRIQITLWAVIVPPLALAWPWIARRLAAPELAKATPFLIAAAILASFGSLVDNYLRAFRMYPASAMLTHFMPRAVLLGGFLSLWLTSAREMPWEVLVSLYMGAQLAAGLGFALSLPRTTAGETSEPRKAQWPPDIRTILGATTAMGLRSAASVLFVSSDLWVLAWARPHAEVAVYGIASRVLQIMGAIPGVANFLIPQEFSVMYADGRTDEMEKLARTASTSVAMIAAASLLGLVLIGRPAIRFAFGPTYLASWGILLILAVGSFWDTASGSAGFALQMSGNHNRLFLLTAGAAVFNLGLSLALAPRWGGYGVATATTTTLILLNLGMVWSAKRLLGVRTFAYLSPARWREILRFARDGGGADGEKA